MRTKPNATQGVIGLLILFTIHARAGVNPQRIFSGPTADMVDTSHGLGIPFGGIGTGFSVFGKYGFVDLLFDGRALNTDIGGDWQVTKPPIVKPTFAFQLHEGNEGIVLQETPVSWLTNSVPVDQVLAYADLPKGHFVFKTAGWGLEMVMTAFSPMKPHDLANSTIPVQVFDITIKNNSSALKKLQLSLVDKEKMAKHGKIAVLQATNGATAFACDGGKTVTRGVSIALKLPPGKHRTVRFYIAWYYPLFQPVSPAMPETYRRYYTKRFQDVEQVIQLAKKSADAWSAAIDRWHAAYDVPATMKRIWFSSLSSAITDSALSDDPYFIEQEIPHPWSNTMDVSAYSSWLYLINWPELERMDMNQYLEAIPKTGNYAGFVWHSLWNDDSAYAEEPTFIGRLYRDFLWFNDPKWMDEAFPIAVLAANQAYRNDHCEHLLHSLNGNQSYDLWKMPGVNSYVNVVWVYSLYALGQMSQIAHQSAEVDGMPAMELMAKARHDLENLLWNHTGDYWNTFYVPTNRYEDPNSYWRTDADATFTDQLFGKWLTLIDPKAEEVLSANQVLESLNAVYTNNLIDDPANGFRGWANGMKPGHVPDMQEHAQTAWFGAQEDLAALLGDVGEEAKSLDVFNSLETSLHNNDLYVGEWNKCVAPDGKSRVSPREPHKDTPRFPPYPRYKSCWQYLITILGLKMDEGNFYLNPFKTINFTLTDVELAGTHFTIKVQSGWNKVFVDGKPQSGPIKLSREHRAYNLQFLRH